MRLPGHPLLQWMAHGTLLYLSTAACSGICLFRAGGPFIGGTMYGWHDRVMDEANHYIRSQTRESDKKTAKADPDLLMTGQHFDSRFYGVGRIQKDQSFYNMQSQFFDQLVREYRWTADPELTKDPEGSIGTAPDMDP